MNVENLTYYECSFTVPKLADRKEIHDIVCEKLKDYPSRKKANRFQYCLQSDATNHSKIVTLRNKTRLNIDLEQVEKKVTFLEGEKKIISVEIALFTTAKNENLKNENRCIALNEINEWIGGVMKRNGFMLKIQKNKIHQDICISKIGRKDLLIPRSTITMEGYISDPVLFSFCWMSGISKFSTYGLGMLNDASTTLNDSSIIKG